MTNAFKASLTGSEIKNLRQRMGWSLAEMARQMGCSTHIISAWECDQICPDFDAVNRLRYLLNHVETTAEHVAQQPSVDREIEVRKWGQMTHRDLLKD